MSKNFLNTLLLSGALLLPAAIASSQMLGASAEDAKPLNAPQAPAEKTSAQDAADKPAVRQEEIPAVDEMTPEEEKIINKRLQKALQPRMEGGNLRINPIELPKTKDGSRRGTSAFVPLPGKDGKLDPNEDSSLIFLYYSNFRMTRTYAAGVGCNVRFNVLTNLDQRLVNLSVKLVWPEMSTNVSFNNVNPNTETYFDYALFGQGCYKMDKIPNIVVNRCRVKGLTQEQCAKKIRWLSKSN